VTCANGIHLQADCHLTSLLQNAQALHAFDILVIPGGGKGVDEFCHVIESSHFYLFQLFITPFSHLLHA
jgi:hypothetical protein